MEAELDLGPTGDVWDGDPPILFPQLDRPIEGAGRPEEGGSIRGY